MKTESTELEHTSDETERLHEVPRQDALKDVLSRRGITKRSFIIGLILAVLHTAWIVHNEICQSQIGGSGGMIFGTALVLILILLTANSIMKRTIPSWMFSPTEIMVIFMMISMATFMAGADLLQQLLPFLLWPFYYDTPASGFSKFFEYVPSHFMPHDKEVIRQFFEGSRDFWRFLRPEILKPWLVPMLFWGGFLFLLAFTMLCMGSILRRQWLDREKLSFPVVDLPMDLAKGITIGSVLRNRLFMTAFLLVTAVYSLNGLSVLFPSVPGISLNVADIGHLLLRDAPLKGMNPIFISWTAATIGFCFLVPLDILFSSWFFYVLIRLSCIPATSLGWRNADAGLFTTGDWPYYTNLAEGALIGMAFMVLWNARKHLVDVARAAFSKEKIPGDEREPLPYRTAFFGAVGGFALLVAIAVISGMRLHIALLFFTIYFLAILVMTRIFAQTVLPMLEFSFFSAGSLLSGLVGTSGMTPKDQTVLTNFYWFNRTYRPHPMGHELEAMVIADRQKQSMRRMSAMMLAAIAVGIITGMVTILQVYYDRGGVSGNVWSPPIQIGCDPWYRLQAGTADPTPVQFTTIIRIAASAGIVLLLGLARNMWIGFPLNPVGYVFAGSYAIEYIWNVVLLVWLVKLVVIRYGGLGTYRKILPFFYGLIIGDAVCMLVWGLTLSALGIKNSSSAVLGPMRW